MAHGPVVDCIETWHSGSDRLRTADNLLVALQYAVDYPGEVAGLLLLAPGAFSRSPNLHPMYSLPEIPVLGPLFLNTLLVVLR